MRVLVTGATGYIGRAVARAARDAGHVVLALTPHTGADGHVRDPGEGGTGMIPVAGDLRDPASLERAARDADAVIHVAHTQADDAPAVDTAAADAFVRALRGSDLPFVYTSGVWVLGASGPPGGSATLDEDAPRVPSPIVAWRGPLEERLVAAARDGRAGTRTVIVRPGIAYGHAGGIPAMLVREAAETGHVRVVGDGRQEWSVVHVDDLAALYVRALEAPAGAVYNAVSGTCVVRDLALAACVAAGRKPFVVSWPLEEARTTLGSFADALELHQRVTSRRAERELGWRPSGRSLLEELLVGSYASASTGTDAFVDRAA
jgi:nucleoside-diphosphate-sugar epimerase